MRLEELINKHKQKLNQTDMVIWKYIYNNRNKCQRVSIHTLAKECCVSSTTIVRFAQKLGFDGFGELKAMLKMEAVLKNSYTENVLADIGSFYETSWKNIIKCNFDEANQLIHRTRNVFAVASGFVQSNVLQELKRLFFFEGILIYEIQGTEELQSFGRMMNKDDLVIIISLSGESQVIIEAAEKIRLRDVPIISITQLHDNNLASLSNVNLYVSTADFHLYDEPGRPEFKSMMPYFLLVEIWYIKYKVYLQQLA